MVPMDDGVKLGATITYPSRDGSVRAPGQFPVVLAMTPYSRNGVAGVVSARAVRDPRDGRGGRRRARHRRQRAARWPTTSSRRARPRTARILIEHFGTQPWSTGKVGMAGGSYVGITQYLAAGHTPPHLAAITPAVAISDLYRDGFAHGGIPNLSFDLQYIAVQGAPGYAGTNTAPVPARADAARPSSASRRPAASRSTTSTSRTTTTSTATAPRSTTPTGSRSRCSTSAAGTTACCAARPRCTTCCRSARASRRGCTWTPARTRAAARRSHR